MLNVLELLPVQLPLASILCFDSLLPSLAEACPRQWVDSQEGSVGESGCEEDDQILPAARKQGLFCTHKREGPTTGDQKDAINRQCLVVCGKEAR